MNDDRYRSIFHSSLPSTDAFRAAHDEMRSWLRAKAYDLDAFDRGDPRVGSGAVLLHSAANSADGAQTERWQLRESKDDGAWLSSLTVHAPADTPSSAATWFWVEIEFAPKDDARQPVRAARAGVPRLTRGLLAAVPAFDSLAMVTAEPMLIGRERSDELIDVLCDPDRRLPAIVASAHPSVSFEEWKKTIGRVMWYLPGLASIYILDPLATRTFDESIGRTHAVWGGAARTYLPDVDPAVVADSLRHRVLSAARIEADPGRAARITSMLPRRLAAELPLPSALAGVNRTLLTRAHGTPDSAGGEGLRSQVRLLASERDIALNLAEEQEQRANALFAQRESALAELAELEQRLLHMDGQVRSLRRHLVTAGRPDVAFLPTEDPFVPPATFAELLDWLASDLSRVEFTGDIEEPLNLDQSPESSTWVRSSWEILRAMEAYADAEAAGRFAGDFKMWCESPPSGVYAIPGGKVVRDESETVRNNPKLRRQREFRIPQGVDPSCRLFMGAHVRIGASGAGRISPRLYFYDAVSSTGKIYIGYLGRHLTNTRS